MDVVRIRLQSQKLPTSKVDWSKLALTPQSLATVQTADIGVTSCCREVFFAGNNAEYCLAAPRIEGIAATAGARAGHDCAVEEVQRKTYNSTIDGLRKIARNEGFTTLWRGLSPTLVMTIPANIIYFTGYDWMRYNPRSPFSKLSPDYAPLTAGSTARVIAVAAVSPIELFRTRMQAYAGETNHFMDTLKGVREMVSTQGYSSLWRGLSLTLWRDVPFSALYWWGYESVRSKLTDMREERRGRSLELETNRTAARRRSQSHEKQSQTFTDSFAAGAMSGAFASIMTMPFDVGKTRTQVFENATGRSVGGDAARAAAPEEGNMMRLLWHIFQTEGAAGLWRGWIPRTLKVAPACAIMISSYEVGKRAFQGINEKAEHQSESS